MKLAEAFVDVRMRTDKAHAEARSEARSIAGEMTKTFARVFSAAVVVRELGKATEAAARLEQAVGGTEAIFGEFSASVDQAAQQSASSMGLSESAFREVTSQIGGLLNGLGFTQDESAKTSVSLAQLGADLAATFGGKPEEAVQALGAALRGEFNPLERFGVSLRVSQINLKAVEMGLASSTTEVDGNARAQAALALITEQTAQAQGQFAREAETASGKSAILAAKFEDARAKLGEQLLPVFVIGVELLEKLVDGFSSLPGPIQVAIVAAAGLAAFVGPIGRAVTAIRGMSAAIKSMSLALLANPVLAAVAGITALGVATWTMTQRANKAADAVDGMAEAMRNADGAAEGLVDYLNDAVSGSDILIEAFDRAGVKTDEFAAAVQAGGSDAEAMYRKLEAAVNDVAGGMDASAALAELAHMIGGAEEAEERFDAMGRVISEADGTVAEAGRTARTTAPEFDVLAAGIEGAEQAAEDAKEAHDELIRSLVEGLGGLFDAESATLALEDSYADLEDQMYKNFLVQNDASKSDREKAASANDLAQQQIATAESALQTAEAYAREMGAADGSAQSAAYQREKLVELQGQYPHLRGEIGQYIAELDAIPGIKDTTVRLHADTSSAKYAIDNFIYSQNGRTIGLKVKGGTILAANGGYFDRATSAIIGEAGPEVALPLTRPSRIRELLDDPRISQPIVSAMGGDIGSPDAGGIGAGGVPTGGGSTLIVPTTVYGTDDAYIDMIAARIIQRQETMR